MDAEKPAIIAEMREWSWKRHSLGEPDSSLAEIQLQDLLLRHHKQLLNLAERALAAPPSSGNWRVGTNISMRYALNQLDASVLDGMFFRFSCPTPQIAADVVTLLNAAPPKLTREQVYYAVRDSGRSDPSRREAITDEIMRLLGVDAPQEGR